MVRWQVTLQLVTPDGFRPAELAALEHDLPAGAALQRTTRGACVVVPGGEQRTAGRALDAAVKQITGACASAGVRPVQVVAHEVLTLEEAARQAENPQLPPVLGLVDAAHVLGVSRQRVHQLVNRHPHFPPPAAHTSATPIWTRASIEAFQRNRQRTAKASGGADQAGTEQATA